MIGFENLEFNPPFVIDARYRVRATSGGEIDE